MAVSKKAKALYNAVFDGIETCAANTIQKYQKCKLLKKYMPKESVPSEYAKAYRAYWNKYGNYSRKWGWYYASRNGNMDVRYIIQRLISILMQRITIPRFFLESNNQEQLFVIFGEISLQMQIINN